MTKRLPVLAAFVIVAALLPAADLSAPQTPTERAWVILQQGVSNKSAAKRVNAIHALRLLPNHARAQTMAESARADSNSKDSKALAMMGVETGVGFAPFGGPAYEVFKRISKDNDSPVRAAATKELATDRDQEIDAALARACSDKKWSVRAAAVYAIAKRDDPALLNVIAPALNDKNDIVRYDASAAVLRLSGDVPAAAASAKVVGK